MAESEVAEETTEDVGEESTEDTSDETELEDTTDEGAVDTDWRESIQDADLRKHAERFTTPEALVKANLDYRKKEGKSVSRLSEDSTDKEVDAYREALGVPNDVDGYELDVLKSATKSIKRFKPIIHIEFAPYLHSEFGYSTNNLISFIENKIKYKFYSEDLKKIENIKSYVKKIKNKSENFFLINKKF